MSAVCFEVLGQLVKICTVLLDGFRDAHGRSSLLTTYIHYHKIALNETSLVSQNVHHGRLPVDSNVTSSPVSPENKHLLDIIRDYERTNAVKAAVEGEGSKAVKKVSTSSF